MDDKHFLLAAQIRTTEYAAVQELLADLIPQSTIATTEEGLHVEGEMEGTSARDLNRLLLSALRRIDRRATLRAEWTTAGVTERFFDYVPKGTRPAQTSSQASQVIPEEDH
jgi:hypothetical protein